MGSRSIAFGLENSQDRSGEEIVDLCRKFLERSSSWDAAEDDIVARREAAKKEPDSVTGALASVVEHEVDYIYRLWNGNYDEALSMAIKTIEGLAGGQELRPYRCFWHHQAAVAAYLLSEAMQNKKLRAVAAEHLNDASKSSIGMHWFQKLRAKLLSQTSPTLEAVVSAPKWFSEIETLLTEWHLKGAKFAKRLAEVQAQIEATDDGTNFERGLFELGRMLGARTHQWSEKGAPDGLWVFDDVIAFVFEAKTDEKPRAVSLAAVRQAATHEARARSDKQIPSYTPCITVLVSNHNAIDRIALPAAGKITHVAQADMINLFKRTSDALAKIRELATALPAEQLVDEALRIYQEAGTSVPDVERLLKQRLLKTLDVRE